MAAAGGQPGHLGYGWLDSSSSPIEPIGAGHSEVSTATEISSNASSEHIAQMPLQLKELCSAEPDCESTEQITWHSETASLILLLIVDK